MKTGRRHELETNQLADSLGHWVDSARPYTNAILALVLIAVLSVGVFAIVQRRSAGKAAEAWNEYFAALSRYDRLKLEDLGEEFPGTPVGWWSLCMAADLGLAEGSTQLFSDKALARDKLHKAADRYQQVLSEAREPSLIRQASYGLARAHECLGEIKTAEEEFQKIAAKWPGTPFAEAASQRVTDLKRQDTKQFYDWFAKQEARKQITPDPGTPGFRTPFDIKSLPDSSSPSRTTTDATPDAGAEGDMPAGDATSRPLAIVESAGSKAPADSISPPVEGKSSGDDSGKETERP